MTSSGSLVLHSTRQGSGPLMVLSHGVGSDLTVWSGLTGVLSEQFTTLAWDQPGHGASQALEDPTAYGPSLAYAALGQMVGNESSVVLVGHSLGGYLSARYAIDHPETVAALVLIATGPGFRAAEAMEKWNADIRRQAEKSGRPEQLVGLHEDAHVMDHLTDITCPTLIIVGSEDKAFLGATDYLERKIPGIERHTLDGAGHMAPATHADAIAPIVSAFLARALG